MPRPQLEHWLMVLLALAAALTDNDLVLNIARAVALMPSATVVITCRTSCSQRRNPCIRSNPLP